MVKRRTLKAVALSVPFLATTIPSISAAEENYTQNPITSEKEQKTSDTEESKVKLIPYFDENGVLKERPFLGHKIELFLSRFNDEFAKEVDSKRTNPNYYPSFYLLDDYVHRTAVLGDHPQLILSEEEKENITKLISLCAEDALSETLDYYPWLKEWEEKLSKFQLPKLKLNFPDWGEKEIKQKKSKEDAIIEDIMEDEKQEGERRFEKFGKALEINPPSKKYITFGIDPHVKSLDFEKEEIPLSPIVYLKSVNLVADETRVRYDILEDTLKYEIKDKIKTNWYLTASLSTTKLTDGDFELDKSRIKLYYFFPNSGIVSFDTVYNIKKDDWQFVLKYSISNPDWFIF